MPAYRAAAAAVGAWRRSPVANTTPATRSGCSAQMSGACWKCKETLPSIGYD